MAAKRIVFLGFKCLLDSRSGAAIQIRSFLEFLSTKGFDCHSISATLFDGQMEYPVHTLLGQPALDPRNEGKIFNSRQKGVSYHIFKTASTQTSHLRQSDIQGLEQFAYQFFKKSPPDLVICFGGMPHDQSLQQMARQTGAKMVFFLANATYTKKITFHGFDQIWCPSDFLCRYYQNKLGIHPVKMLGLTLENYIVSPSKVLSVAKPECRGKGFITYLNPSLQKGATLFLQLYQIAQKAKKDWTFLLVEGRISARIFSEQFGVDIAQLPNIWWLPNQKDIRSVYQRTSVLLFPSFWEEASGRSIAEAQLCGIPVLASSHAGIPEQINGGGFLFDIPEQCRQTYGTIPSESDVMPWFNRVSILMEDQAEYVAASQKARHASRHLMTDQVSPSILKLVNELCR